MRRLKLQWRAGRGVPVLYGADPRLLELRDAAAGRIMADLEPEGRAVTIRLRGHHLLCVLTYVGRGYSPAFTDNLDRVAARLGSGEEVLIVEGPDDVCVPMLEGEFHCPGDSVRERDALALASISGLLGRPLAPGELLVLDAATVSGLRSGFASGALRPACSGCDWADVCTAVAGDGYRGGRLHPRDPTS